MFHVFWSHRSFFIYFSTLTAAFSDYSFVDLSLFFSDKILRISPVWIVCMHTHNLSAFINTIYRFSSTPPIGFHQHHLPTFMDTTYRLSSTSFTGLHQHHRFVFIIIPEPTAFFRHRFEIQHFHIFNRKEGPLIPETHQHVNNTKTRYGGIGPGRLD